MNNDRAGDQQGDGGPRPGETPSGQKDSGSVSLTTRGGDHLAASPLTPSGGTPLTPSGGTPLTPAGSSPSAGPSIDLDQTVVPGQVLFDCYETIRKLGQGGMGQVWLVRHTDLNDERALKFIVPEIAFDEEIRRRFRREAQVLASFKHPNVVRINNARLSTRVAYFDMEYLPGRGLERVLRPGVTISLDQAASILAQLCDVLQAAHERGIVHRDLKPANLMLVEDPITGKEVLKVLDFGIVKVLLTEKEHDATRTQGFLGTYAYASPEQILGEEIDGRSDIYSVGVILFQMLTGHRPFGGTEFALMHDVVKVEPPAFSEKNPDHGVPPELEGVVRRCLAKAPEDRYQTARELSDAFLGCMTALWPESASTGPSWSSRPSASSQSALLGEPNLGGTETAVPGFEPTDEDVEHLAAPTEAGSTSQVELTEVDPDRSRRAETLPRPNRLRNVAVVVVLVLVAGTAGVGLVVSQGLPLLVGRASSDSGRIPVDDDPETPIQGDPLGNVPETEPSLLETLYTPEAEAAEGGGPPPVLIRKDEKRFIRIEGGEFRMGAFDDECDVLDQEKPVHVRRVSTFYMQEHEVTFGEIERFLQEAGGRDFRKSDDYEDVFNLILTDRFEERDEVLDYPAVGVSRRLAEAYAHWVGGHLPTEGQYEYAARSQGLEIHCVWQSPDAAEACDCIYEPKLANLNTHGQEREILVSTRWSAEQRKRLGIFPGDQTAQGILDLAGNAREWCRDVWRSSYTRLIRDDHVELPRPGESTPEFVIRGGSFESRPETGRTTWRDKAPAEETDIDLGFRVVLELPPGHPWAGPVDGDKAAMAP